MRENQFKCRDCGLEGEMRCECGSVNVGVDGLTVYLDILLGLGVKVWHAFDPGCPGQLGIETNSGLVKCIDLQDEDCLYPADK